MKKNLLSFSVLALLTAFMFSACTKDEAVTPENPNNPAPAARSIAAIAQADTNFSYLVTALSRAELVATLNGSGSFTVFAPTNSAFRASGISEADLNSMPVADLTTILLYHVLGTKVEAAQVSTGYVNTLADGPVANAKLSAFISTASGVRINDAASVVSADVQASNGVIHVIDRVLLPADLATLATVNANLSTVVGAVVTANLVDAITYDPSNTDLLTLFAPENNAFTVSGLDLGSFSVSDLTNVLLYHVVAGNVRSSAVATGTVPTLNTSASLNIQVAGGLITINPGTGNVNNAGVVSADIQGTNGVMHIINRVLVPGS